MALKDIAKEMLIKRLKDYIKKVEKGEIEEAEIEEQLITDMLCQYKRHTITLREDINNHGRS